MYRLILSILMLGVLQFRIDGQTPPTAPQHLVGKVIDAVRKTSLTDVYISQWHSGEKINAHFSGSFDLNISIGDSMLFHSMGYTDTLIICTQFKDSLIVPLRPNVIVIETIKVQAHSDESVQVKMPFTTKQIEAEMKAASGVFGHSWAFDFGHKKQKEYEEFIEKNRKYSKIYELTSYENIGQLTCLHDAPLDSFVYFLRTNYQFNPEDSENKTFDTIMIAFHEFCLINKFLVHDKTYK